MERQTSALALTVVTARGIQLGGAEAADRCGKDSGRM